LRRTGAMMSVKSGSVARSVITRDTFIEFKKSFGKCQFPHKFVNLPPIITNVKDKLTDLHGN
jgi:hypothetical protein